MTTATANYKIRDVTASEIAKACGSARKALRITRGDNATALHFIHNPHLIESAKVLGRPRKTKMTTDLRVMAGAERSAQRISDLAERAAIREHNWQQRLTVARRAYATHGTIVAVSRACKCDARTSKKLIAEIEATP